MKKFSSFLLLMSTIMFATFTDAQTFTLGVRSGLSIPNLTAGGSETNPLNTGYKSRLGPDEAIFGEYHFSSLFSLEAMIEYSSQGGKKTGMQAFPNPQGSVPPYLYADFKSEAKLNYLLVPVLAKFGWNLSSHSPVRIYFDAGPFAGFLLSAHQVTSGSSKVYADPQGTQPASPSAQPFNANNDIKDQLNTFNFGVSGNVGFAYHFSKSNIFIEGGGNYGFVNIQKGTANGKNHAGAGTVALGYGYTFGK
ncbi:MAG: porin family protein [Ginsengibacter sp.]